MTRGGQGVTCRECGCLNFNSEREVCDRCRPQTLTFRPAARRLVGSAKGYALSTRPRESRAHSLCKKRRHNKTKKASNTKTKPKNVAIKQPDVIDLISDDDDDDVDVDVQQRVPNKDRRQRQDEDNLETGDGQEKERERLFQSRVFSSVTFVDSHFPSVNAVATMKKQAAKNKLTVVQPTDQTSSADVTSASDAISASNPIAPTVLRPAQEKAAESTPPLIAIVENNQAKKLATLTPSLITIVESNQAKTPLTTIPKQPAKGKTSDAATTNGAKKLDVAADSQMEVNEAEQVEVKLEDSLFQSRVLDSIEFQASGFITIFDGLAVARRSHPPNSKAMTSNGTSLTSVGAILATEFEGHDATDVAEPTKATTVASSTTASASAAPSPATTRSTVSLPSESAAQKVPASTRAAAIPATSSPTPAITTPAIPLPAKSSTTPAITTPAKSLPAKSSTTPAISSPAKLLPAKSLPTKSSTAPAITTPAKSMPAKLSPAKSSSAKWSLATPSASAPPLQSKEPVASAALPPAPAKLPPLAVKAPAKVTAVPSTKVPSLPSQVSSVKMQSTAMATSSPPTPAAVKQNPAVSASSAMKATLTTASTTVVATFTPQNITVANTIAAKTSCAPASLSDRAQANDSLNVLLPKKKHPEEVVRSDELQRRQKPSPFGVNAFLDADGILFVKVNPAPREMAFVEQPVMGHCSPNFLEFMRERGDDDGDEVGDPDEVSRSQLKLLDVVDLTNLSESDDSDADSPLSTPRVRGPKGEVEQRTLLPNEQVGKEVQSTVCTTVDVYEKGIRHVPILDGERKRTHPKKIMCELCEEKGISSRLIRCPICTKYYHKKCARENGDENICWNCELGSMIDDSELDEEHAKHNSEYLAYLRALRYSPEEGENAEDEIVAENEDQEGEQVATEEDVEMASTDDGNENRHLFPEERSAKSTGKRWKEFIGDATADIDASYIEVTKCIAEELRDDEKRCLYSRGFVSREEFEAQMTEVEEYYINEEARLQQLEREKALEAKKVAEARKAQAEAEQTIIAEQPAGNSTIADSTAAILKPVIHDQASPFTTTTVVAPPIVASKNPTVPTAPMAAPAAMHSTLLHR